MLPLYYTSGSWNEELVTCLKANVISQGSHNPCTPGVQVLITAVEHLLEGDDGNKMNSSELVWMTVVMVVATAAKLALYLFCRTFKSEIVHAYSLVSSCRHSALSGL